MSEFDVRYGYIDERLVLGRLIRNPNYGGDGVSLNGWRTRPSISNHTKPGFQQALEESIQQEGQRNPILVWSLPEGVFLTFGGSRLKAIRNLGLSWVKAIINDYTGDFAQEEEVTPENWRRFFKDPPREVEFGEYGFDYHYNLERARRHLHDPAGFAWLEGEDAAFLRSEFPWVYK